MSTITGLCTTRGGSSASAFAIGSGTGGFLSSALIFMAIPFNISPSGGFPWGGGCFTITGGGFPGVGFGDGFFWGGGGFPLGGGGFSWSPTVG